MEDHIEGLKSALCESVKNSVSGSTKIGILFSGGLDSSLLAHLVRQYAGEADITLYTVGTVVSHDIIKARQASYLLKMDLKEIVIKSGDIESSLPQLARIIGSRHPVRLSYELPMFFGLRNARAGVVLSGQGADELFGGYSRYLRMEGRELEDSLVKDIEALITSDIAMDRAIAGHLNRKLATPFLDKQVVALARKIPVRYKVKEGQRKIVLRETALELGLPAELAGREKKAAQYSSGMIKELRRMAKMRGMQVNELIDDILSGKNGK